MVFSKKLCKWLIIIASREGDCYRNRGDKDILIVCVDGITGFSEAINAIFPQTLMQKYGIHKIHYTLKFVASKGHKEFFNDLRNAKNAPTEKYALFE